MGREIDGFNQKQTPLTYSSSFCKIVRTASLRNTYEEILLKMLLYFVNFIFVSIMSNVCVVII